MSKKALITRVDNYDMDVLKGIIDNLMVQLKEGLIFIANVRGNNVNFVCRSNISTKAGELVKNASIKSLGNGGGSRTFAQGGGTDATIVPKLLVNVKEKISNL